MPNRLASATSPYLLEHASNPVDWYPWGDEAIERARREHKVIFLSIGYAACHWCHVMAHESFEDSRTAAILNEHFISIKVDREQRPDLDGIYMQATMALTGSGGWPMSVFLTPDLRPFFAGTYFPPVTRFNLPAFPDLLLGIANSWQSNPGAIQEAAARLLEHLQPDANGLRGYAVTARLLDDAGRTLAETHDREYGGWGSAPKFPQPMAIDFLLRRAAGATAADASELKVALHTLKAMARGGMYDVVGGGFCRYSTDNQWRVPHFEKMLYDNAQLALAYLHAWQITHNEFFKGIVVETLDFVTRELTHPDGGFFSSLNADSEGVEGKYYLWTKDEIRQALPEQALLELFVAAYAVTEQGNWEGKIILQRALDDASLAARFRASTDQIRHDLSRCHARLREARSQRIRPSTDDKVLASWNGLMLRAFAQAARFIDDPTRTGNWAELATRSAAFLLQALRRAGRLCRTWRDGSSSPEVFLEDFAGLILGLLDLYQLDFENRWFAAARQLADEMVSTFADSHGGFFDVPAESANLLYRPKDLQDGATPSGNALACEALLKLASLTGESRYRDLGESALTLVTTQAGRYPTAFAGWLNAADFALSGNRQLAILHPRGASPGGMLSVVNSTYRPNLVIATTSYPPPNDAPALLAGRPLVDDRPTAYLCQDFACKLPTNSPEDLQRQLQDHKGPR